MSASAVHILWVDARIVIHVKAMKLELIRGGRVVLRTEIAPGAPETPTPLGRFYVTQRLVPKDPNGPWGPAALGTSAFSPVLKSWAQGGPIGIHGTNEPWAIGHAVSHGCIRLPNAQMKRLFDEVPAGTPIRFAPSARSGGARSSLRRLRRRTQRHRSPPCAAAA